MRNSAIEMICAALLLVPSALSASNAIAVDCATEAPFAEVGRVKVELLLERFSNANRDSGDDSCKKEVMITAFDVRGREEAAYDCLKPKPEEVVTCDSVWNGAAASFIAVPAVWIRNAKGESLTEIRFHAYVQEKTRPYSYIDIFSRTLSENFPRNKIILEGASSYGPEAPIADNYWVRATFGFSTSRNTFPDATKDRNSATSLSVFFLRATAAAKMNSKK